MTRTPFDKIFRESRLILTEGALVERLKAEFGAEMDADVNHAGFIYTYPEMLETLYRQYIDIAEKHRLPVMIMTPTRRVNVESHSRSRFHDKDLITDSCSFLNRIRESYADFSEQILIGGLPGCRGDAYSGEKIMGIEESYHFHSLQTRLFQDEKVDYLFAGIMPELNEATGMAMAMSDTGIPYIISFMLRKNGRLMDGTLLSEAIRSIDANVSRKPLCYLSNCIHPSNLTEALNHEENKNSPNLQRFCGIQANSSELSPEELNHSKMLHTGDFNRMIEEMAALQHNFGLKIFGGCCGTNDEFTDQLSCRLSTGF